MKILIAEDDAFSRKLLEATLEKAGYETVSCVDGEKAIEAYKQDTSIEIAILDWMMPGKDGLEVCRAIKSTSENSLTYVIMLTAKNRAEDIAEALESYADDFVSKPFDALELNTRINAGVRKIRLQNALMDNIQELQEVLARVEQLQGILPICARCKKIRDDSKYCSFVKECTSKYSETQFSHNICPECEAEEMAVSKNLVTQESD